LFTLSCDVIAFAAVSGPMPKLGVVVVALLGASALLARSRRARALAMLGALLLAPVLLLADIWDSPQLHVVHRHPLFAGIGAVIALGVVGVVAFLLVRRPALLAPLTVLALPFRVPISAGGSTSNLLVPLYLVVAAGTLSWIVRALRNGDEAAGRHDGPRSSGVRWIERLLASYVVLYAVQSLYSNDFEKALQQMVFFYVPFTLLFCLLRGLDWNARLIRVCLQVLVVLALLFAAVGFVEYATKTILLNPKLIAANDVHAYFTVNSVFFDPDIFGRFLALVMILVAAVLLDSRDPREQIAAIAVLGVLWGALVLTLSRSSLAALLVGLGTLAAVRWRASRVLVVGVAVVAAGAAAIAITPKTFGLNQGLNNASSGRADLVTGGLSMFGSRTVWGYGSGSFVREYHRRHPDTTTTHAASHTIPITIAAEQGLIGLLVYLALILTAIVVLIRGTRADPVRAAVGAAWLALVFHTLLYADFLEDPFAWSLLGIGTALATAHARAPVRSRRVMTDPGQPTPVAA
jgi:putative inorganic carbon (HCO3(-)) transporter